ncbi:exosortase F system-associated membrane protein [Lutibacter sp.]
MTKTVKILLIVILFFMLIAVRAFIQPYFYDPLITYFKNDYLLAPIPEIKFTNFFLNLLYRYTLNTVISIAIIYVVYTNLKVLKFSIKFYVIAFIVLSSILFMLLKFDFNTGYRLIFYVRRFLIHPVFLLVLLPAFYYQNLKIEK